MENMGTSSVLLVIFGITGDLAQRKLLPALYSLARENLLHPNTQIIGVTRQSITKKEILQKLDRHVASHARPSPAAVRRFADSFHLFNMDLAEESGYKKLHEHLMKLEQSKDIAYRRLYYLSVPPAVIDEVVGNMAAAGLQRCTGGDKLPILLVEKPFGYDLSSARKLISSIHASFTEDQIYRIDHYLAKEMAQSILDFRFANELFAHIWNRRHISKIVITAH